MNAFDPIPRRSVENYHLAREPQLQLVKDAAGTRTLREFGGLFIVHGKYLLEAAAYHRASLASMIDITPVPEFKDMIAKARELSPDMEVEFVNCDFRAPQLFEVLRPVDTSILFNVLLHQENYVSVIGGVCRKSEKYVCVTQPCLREEHFSVPCSATLLQFWPDEIKDKYRAGEHWLDEGEIPTFTTARWMWGHTTSHLIDVFRGFGWQLESAEILDEFLGPHWEYPLLRFVPGARRPET